MTDKMDVLGPAGSSVGEEAAAALAGGASLVMLENEKLFAFAIQRPRDEDKVLADLKAVVRRSALFADEAIYSKPVGRELNPQTGKYDGEMKYAEGLSIRAMEECRRLYGNNGVAVTVAGETPDGVRLAAVFVDYERGGRLVIEKIAPRQFKTRDGKVMLHPPDRYTDLVIPKNVSIALREVISRSIPAWMKAELEAACRARMSKVKPEIRQKRMVEAFAKLPVPVPTAKLEEYMGKHLRDMKHRELNILQGVYNAIKDGELTAEEVFGIKATAAAPAAESAASDLKPKGGLFDGPQGNGTTQA